jgi:hypothetical protein
MASTYTPKLNLAKPAHGDVDWHIPVNENWDKIDTELDKALKISGTMIDADKNWNGKNITNVGTLQVQTINSNVTIIPGHLELLRNAASVTIPNRLVGTGYVKIVVNSPAIASVSGWTWNGTHYTRTVKVFKNGVEIFSKLETAQWNGDGYEWGGATYDLSENYPIVAGDSFTVSTSPVTVMLYGEIRPALTPLW